MLKRWLNRNARCLTARLLRYRDNWRRLERGCNWSDRGKCRIKPGLTTSDSIEARSVKATRSASGASCRSGNQQLSRIGSRQEDTIARRIDGG